MSTLHKSLASPYTVRVIDNAFEESLVRAADVSWPGLDWEWWHVYRDKDASKYASRSVQSAPTACLKLLHKMSEYPVHETLGNIQSAGIFPDFSFYGGGLHALTPGGYLRRHVDALDHPQHPWQRAVNLILYVNEGWKEEWGGAFEIYRGTELAHLIEPKFNRLVVFCPNDEAWHGVQQVSQDAKQFRRSLATFFWRKGESRGLNTSAKFEHNQVSSY